MKHPLLLLLVVTAAIADEVEGSGSDAVNVESTAASSPRPPAEGVTTQPDLEAVLAEWGIDTADVKQEDDNESEDSDTASVQDNGVKEDSSIDIADGLESSDVDWEALYEKFRKESGVSANEALEGSGTNSEVSIANAREGSAIGITDILDGSGLDSVDWSEPGAISEGSGAGSGAFLDAIDGSGLDLDELRGDSGDEDDEDGMEFQSARGSRRKEKKKERWPTDKRTRPTKGTRNTPPRNTETTARAAGQNSHYDGETTKNQTDHIPYAFESSTDEADDIPITIMVIKIEVDYFIHSIKIQQRSLHKDINPIK